MADDPQPLVSTVLAAADPQGLARFYGALLETPPQVGFSSSHWRLSLPGGGTLELYAPSQRRPLLAAGGRQALCLRRRGARPMLETWIAAACDRGAQLEEGPREEPFGWEAWLRDPEGNRLLLLTVPT